MFDSFLPIGCHGVSFTVEINFIYTVDLNYRSKKTKLFLTKTGLFFERLDYFERAGIISDQT